VRSLFKNHTFFSKRKPAVGERAAIFVREEKTMMQLWPVQQTVAAHPCFLRAFLFISPFPSPVSRAVTQRAVFWFIL